MGGNREARLCRVHHVEVVAHQDFDNAFRENYGRLVGLGTAMSGDYELARDLAQETMLRAHDRWDEVVRFDNPGAWMRRVMTNLVIDQHRRRTRERAALTRLSGRARAIETQRDRGVIWGELIDTLPMRQRAIVALHYGDDLSVDDVARLLQISPGTVKSALSKARQKLRELIEGDVRRHG